MDGYKNAFARIIIRFYEATQINSPDFLKRRFKKITSFHSQIIYKKIHTVADASFEHTTKYLTNLFACPFHKKKYFHSDFTSNAHYLQQCSQFTFIFAMNLIRS